MRTHAGRTEFGSRLVWTSVALLGAVFAWIRNWDSHRELYLAELGGSRTDTRVVVRLQALRNLPPDEIIPLMATLEHLAQEGSEPQLRDLAKALLDDVKAAHTQVWRKRLFLGTAAMNAVALFLLVSALWRREPRQVVLFRGVAVGIASLAASLYVPEVVGITLAPGARTRVVSLLLCCVVLLWIWQPPGRRAASAA